MCVLFDNLSGFQSLVSTKLATESRQFEDLLPAKRRNIRHLSLIPDASVATIPHCTDPKTGKRCTLAKLAAAVLSAAKLC